MLTNNDGNILIANSISFTNKKISVTTYNDINHYNNGDTAYIKKVTSSINIPINYTYPKNGIKDNGNADEDIIILIETIIKDIDSSWSTV